MTDPTAQPVEIPEALLSPEALRQARDMPWKAGNEFRRLMVLPLSTGRCEALTSAGAGAVTAFPSFSAIAAAVSASGSE